MKNINFRLLSAVAVILPATGLARADFVQIAYAFPPDDTTMSFTPTTPVVLDRVNDTPRVGSGETTVDSRGEIKTFFSTVPPDSTLGPFSVTAVLDDTAHFTGTGTATISLHTLGFGVLPPVDANMRLAYDTVVTSLSVSDGTPQHLARALFANQPRPGYTVPAPGVPFPIDLLVTDTLTFSGTLDVPFTIELFASGVGGASLDLFHTAQLSFDLPPGVSVSTDGGFFQSGSAAVPEPSSFPLLATGVTGLYIWRRRKIRGGMNKRVLTLCLFAAIATALAIHVVLADNGQEHILFLDGRVVAAGILGVSAVAPVGTFLPGGPIPANFAAFTQPGKVLDPKRILVGSTSNFGEPLSDPHQLPGSFLSIDPTGSSVLIVPPDFAAGGGQASALGGFVQMYSSQNPAFLNSIHNRLAPTANFTGVSNPLGLSINNAFGRLWPANAPYGLPGMGSSTILDPSGEPLAGAPNPTLIGGVYSGNLTNRNPQVIRGGLNTGGMGTAFLGHSPDGSMKAVFAVVCADGSIVQEHTLKGLDGLAPPGTISPVLAGPWNRGGNHENHPQPRAGVLLNYSPTRVLYVSEVFTNSIATIGLTDDGLVFHVGSVHHIYSAALNEPIDLAPVAMETTIQTGLPTRR